MHAVVTWQEQHAFTLQEGGAAQRSAVVRGSNKKPSAPRGPHIRVSLREVGLRMGCTHTTTDNTQKSQLTIAGSYESRTFPQRPCLYLLDQN